MTKWSIGIGWGDVPHLTPEDRAELMASIPPYQRDARTLGIPQLGSGVIYPVDPAVYEVEPFDLPAFWPRAYALDVGWNRTAALWGGWDRQNDCVYLYSEHYMAEAPPQVHADAIRGRGDWIPGVIDPASSGANQKDGTRLRDEYSDLGLHLELADNTVEAGIHAVYRRLVSGRLKVFTTLSNFRSEIRLYRRDEKGKIVKERDHLMDCCLVGSTVVETVSGPCRLDQLPERGELVGRMGSRASFIAPRLTRRDAEVVRLEFDDGRSATCTPDHKFLTPQGWVRADCMAGASCYDAVAQRIQWSQWKSWLSLRPFRSLTASAITSAGTTFSRAAERVSGDFIASYGSGTMARSLMGSMSTTATRTGATISPATLPSYLVANTSPTIKSAISGVSLPWLPSARRRGTVRQRAFSGTSPTTKTSAISCKLARFFPVSSAEPTTRRRTTGSRGSAPTPARPALVSYPALMMKNALAWFAAWASWSIAIVANRPAAARALVRCKAVQSAGTADVYCVTVPGASAFAINGGLTVHNCRYLIMSGMALGVTQPRGDEYVEEARGRDQRTGY